MDETVPLVEQYRPETTADVQGNNTDIDALETWLASFSDGDSPHLLYGPPGVGKTSTAYALANDYDLPVLEVNASDSRTTDDIERVVDIACSRTSDGSHKMVVLDEADSMSGRSNMRPLYDLLDSPPNPILVVCNDKYEVPDGITNRCVDHKFSLGVRSRKAKLREIVKAEDIEIGASRIGMLAERSNLRDAIQDLQRYRDRDTLGRDSVREYDESVFDEVDRVIKGRSVSLSQTPVRSLRWIDKNIRDRYRLVEAAAAWDALARADRMNARVWAGSGDPDYRWWRYSSVLQEMVPNLRLSSAYDGYIDKSSPDFYGSGDHPAGIRALFDALSKRGGRGFGLGDDIDTFRRWVLPRLLDRDVGERREIALSYGVSDSGALRALDLSPDSFAEWKSSRNETGGPQSSVLDW